MLLAIKNEIDFIIQQGVDKSAKMILPFTVSSAEWEETPAAFVAVLIKKKNHFYIST
jgi:hypothetical protein